MINIVSGDSCTLTINGGINVDEYEITNGGLNNENYELDSYENVKYRIIAAEYDISGIQFNNVGKEYNAQMQKPEIVDILPSGVTVSYTTGSTNVSDGIVSVTATFISNDTNYNNPKSMKATIKILPNEITAIWSNTVYDYDGSKHLPIVSLSVLFWDDVFYSIISGYGINAGSYECEIV